MLLMSKISFICWINSTKLTSNPTLSWFMLWKCCSFCMQNMSSTAQLLLLGIFPLQELMSTRQLLEQRVHFMAQNTEEQMKLSWECFNLLARNRIFRNSSRVSKRKKVFFMDSDIGYIKTMTLELRSLKRLLMRSFRSLEKNNSSKLQYSCKESHWAILTSLKENCTPTLISTVESSIKPWASQQICSPCSSWFPEWLDG